MKKFLSIVYIFISLNLGMFCFSSFVSGQTPGTFSLLSPANGVYTNSTPVFTWGVSSNVLFYKLFINGVLKKDSIYATSYTLNSSQSLSEGMHIWNVKSCNTTGSIQSNQTWSILVDSTAPTTFDLISPANTSWSNNLQPTFQWGASSDIGSGLAKYQIWIDGSLNKDNISASATSSTPYNLSNGTHTWQIKAVDNVGNIRSSNQTWVIKIDNVPPSLGNLSALSFNGVNGNYVHVGNNSLLNMTYNTTIEFWFKFLPGGSYSPRIISKQTDEYNMEGDYAIYTSGTGATRRLRFWIKNIGEIETPYDLTSNTFYHVAATISGNSSSCVMRLYINGVQWGYLSTSGTITPTSSPLVFGRKAAGSNYYDMFCGIIDEVRIWNYCKTVSQINEQKDIPLFGTEPGLIGYWNFDEGTGTTAYDLTLHNNASIYGPTYLYNINILRFLKYPAQNQYIQNNLTTFSWGNSKDAGIGFQKFQLFIDGNLNKDNFTDSVYTVIAPLSYGAHTWFVKGFDLLGNNQSSETRTYYVDNALPYPFNLISPTDSQIVNIPTPNFSWQGTTDSAGGSGLRKYQLIINYIVSVDSIPVNTTTSSPGNALPQGSYTFYVKAYDNVANIRQSTQTRTFYVDWEPPTPFTLISPSNGDTSVTKRPVFTWHKSTDIGSGLVKYELIISGQPIITLPGADSSKQITFDLPNGNYTWYVKAYDRAGSFRSSNVNSLTVNVLPVPVAPLLSQPINNSVNQPTDLIFKWGIPNEYLKFSYDFSSNKSALTVLKYWYEVTTDTISFTNLMRDTILTDTLKNVTGLSNLTTFYWRVKAKNQYSYGPFSIWYKFTTTGLSSISLNSNWNIFSMPLQAQNMSVISLIPGASSSAFAYNSGYQQVTTLQNGKGYWIKYDSARTFIVTGIAVNPRICAVNEGWNIIGPFESEVAVSAITSNPPGIIVSQFFGFNNGYSNATTLTSGKGYWIKTTQSGTLILPQSTDISLQVENKPEVNENWMSIEITDSKQNKAKLYLGEKENVFGVYELPPVGPSGVFDVRFASDNFVDIWSGSHTVKISSPEYPVKIKIENIKGKLLRIKDNISGKILNQAVTEKTVITVNSPLSAFSIIADNMIPTTYDLSQNYPNPFNPVTTIKYQIPKDGLVKLIIYDVLGREIKILVNEIKTAGYYDIKFDASYLSSGIYFYRFYTGNYTSIKKMMVIK